MMALAVSFTLFLATLANLAFALPLSPNATTTIIPNFASKAAAAIPTHYPPDTSAPDEFALVALDALNKMRTASGLRPLCISAKLQQASQKHSNWMSQTQIFQHSKGGFWENIAVQGEGYYLPGKTCFGNGAQKATNLRASAEFTTNCQWYTSPGHYKGMMKPEHTRAGIAYAIGPYDGFKGYWWTQSFDSGDEPCIAGGTSGSPKQPEPPAKPTRSAPTRSTTTISASLPTASSTPPASVTSTTVVSTSFNLGPPSSTNIQIPTPALTSPVTRPDCPFKSRTAGTETTSAVSGGIETPSPTAPVDPPATMTKPECPFKKTRTEPAPTGTETLIETTSAVSGGIETPAPTPEPSSPVTTPECPFKKTRTSTSPATDALDAPTPIPTPDCPFKKSRTITATGVVPTSEVSGDHETATAVPTTSAAPEQPPCPTETPSPIEPTPVVPTEVVGGGSGKKQKKTNKCRRRKRQRKATRTTQVEAGPTKTADVNGGYDQRA